MNVLIYGFGWTGRACLHLLESFGISCKIIDDNCNISSSKFVKLDNVKEFDLILIAISNKQEVINSIKNRILAAGGGGEYKVRNISLDGYSKSQAKFLIEFYKDKYNFLESLLNDDFYLVKFAEVFKIIKVKHKQFLKDKAKDDYNRRITLDKTSSNLSVFSKMYQGFNDKLLDFDDGETSSFLLVNYPGSIVNAFGDTADRNLFLKEEIDFISLRNRDKDIKLVVLFGACTIRGGQGEEAFVVKYLREMLNSNFVVLNCGLSAVIWENFLFFNTFLYPLFPDIVVNLCFSEIILCQYDCDVCLNTYQIPYSPTYELNLGNREDSMYSYYQMTINGKQNFKNPNIDKDDIFRALDIRLLQFSSMVTSYGGKFYAVIHPFLHLKTTWSKEEKWANALYNKQNPGVYNGCEDLESLVNEFLQKERQIKLYNSNDYIKDSKETLFKDWIHINETMAKKLAEYIFKIIKEK